MIGTQIGRYRIDDELGRGGMGVVYRGTQVTLDRTVAIKMLPAHLADTDNRARFRREALTLARLAHPNIVHIYDVEEEEGHSFIMMEHVGGGSLGDRMQAEAPFSATGAVAVVAPILSALHAAHLAGVVHRDIKPDNILFTESGRPRLTDFGIAHLRDSGSRTRTGVMLGTPYYMSPEQAQGRPVTAAADLYAVGVVLYEMLGARVPFTGDDPLSVALKHVQETPLPLRELRPDLPVELCDLVHRALRKDPEARYSSAAAMQDALESAGSAPQPAPGVPSTAPPTAAPSAAPSAGATGGSSAAGTSAGPSAGASAGASGGSPTGSSPGGDPASSSSSDQPAADSGRRPTPLAEATAALSSSTSRGAAVAGEVGRGTLEWLATPGWRGYPRAFWSGAVALLVAASWWGAEALAGGGSSAGAPPAAVRETAGGGEAGATPAAGGPASVRPPGAAGLAERPGEPVLSEEDRTALVDLVRGEPEQAASSGDGDADADATGEGADPLDRIDARTPGPLTLDDLRPTEPEAESSASDRELVRTIVDRQFRAVEAADRTLFLRDFHPEVRSQAAAEFDAAASAATNIRSTLSNLSIEFPEPDHAFVTLDVALSFTVRSDGRTVRESYEEMWDLRREGDRWWIVAWN